MTGIRTLIVDDDPAVRRLHARYLADVPGFVLVGEVGRGAAAAAEASRADVDLVLLDMHLPDFSGIEVLRRLREARGSAVDVLVISSSRDRVTVRQALSAHVVGYLVKPFTQEAFAQRLAGYRDARRETHEPEADIPLAQGEIDGMLRPDAAKERPVAPPSPPKGVSPVTLERIRAHLDPVRPATVAELAAASGVSKPTVRRYLDYLVQCGVADISHRYGKRGRPEVLYRSAVG